MATQHDELRDLLDYLRWADARMIEAIRKLPADRYTAAEPAPGWNSIRSSVVHIGGASRIWAQRLAGETVTTRPTEETFPTVDDAERLLAEAHAALVAQLDRRTPEQLDSVWTYTNLAGESASLRLADVFRHVVNHATYHRGQVASKIRLLGGEPPATDLVYWAIERARPGSA